MLTMFNGYNDTPLISYEFSQERGDKKAENGVKWTYGHDVGTQPAQPSDREFWSGKSNFLGIPNIVKCNCAGCYPPPEKQSYQGDLTRHRPWLPRTFPPPVNGTNEPQKLPTYQWDGGQPCYADVGNLSYESCEKYPYYKHYQRLTEPNQLGVITSVKNAELGKKSKNPGRDEPPLQNGIRQQVYPNPAYGLSKRVDGRNYPVEKFPNMASFSADQHTARLPVVEPFTKAVPSNLSQNRVPSTGYRSVKENMPQSYVEFGYGSGMNGDYIPVVEQQKFYFDNTRHDFYPRGNYQDVMKRNGQTLDARKDCYVSQMSEMAEYNVPRSKYQDVVSSKSPCDAFYPKEMEKPRLENDLPDNSACFPRTDDTKVENPNFQTKLHPSTMVFNDPRFADRTQNSFSYQNSPVAYRNYLGREFPCQGLNNQRYEYPGTVQRNDQYRPTVQQEQVSQQGNYIEENFRGKAENSSYLESIRGETKNGTSKISPLRLLRKKKFINLPPPQETVPISTLDSVPGLDVRKFWSTWADGEEENVAPTQMVVLDCQNIDPEEAKLLHLCETDPVRPEELEPNLSTEHTQLEDVTELVTEPKIPKETDSEVVIVNQNEEVEEGSHKTVPEPETEMETVESVVQKSSKPKKSKTVSEKKKSETMDKWTEKKFGFLKRAEESKAAEVLRQEEEKKKIIETRLSLQQSLKKMDKPPEKNKENETPSLLEESLGNSPPSTSEPNLPTSEYRRNKFLDYSENKVTHEQDKDPLGEIKKEGSPSEEPGLDDILKKISEMNFQPESIKSKKPKKPKRKKEEKPDEDRTDKLTVETVTKPTIKFSIQKSHDLKISFKVLNSSNSVGGEEETVDEGTINEDAKNSTEMITLKYKSIQREGGQESENNRRRKKGSKTPVLKIKKSRYMPEEEKDPLADDDDDVSDKRSDGFQVQETMDSAKIKLTFKRRKRNFEAEYKTKRNSIEKCSEVECTPEDETEVDTTKRKSKKKKKKEEEIFAEAGIESFGNYLEGSDVESCSDELKPRSESTLEDSRNSSVSSGQDGKCCFEVPKFEEKSSDDKVSPLEEPRLPDETEESEFEDAYDRELAKFSLSHLVDKPEEFTFPDEVEEAEEGEGIEEISPGRNAKETEEEEEEEETAGGEITNFDAEKSSYELKSEKDDDQETTCVLETSAVADTDVVNVVSSSAEDKEALDLCSFNKNCLEDAPEECGGAKTSEETNNGLLILGKTTEVESAFDPEDDLEKNSTQKDFSIQPSQSVTEKSNENQSDTESGGRSDFENLLGQSENPRDEVLLAKSSAETFSPEIPVNSSIDSAQVSFQLTESNETLDSPVLVGEVRPEEESSERSAEDTNDDPLEEKCDTGDVDEDVNSAKGRAEDVESSRGDDSGCAECSFITDEVSPWEDAKRNDVELEDGEIVDSCDEEGAQTEFPDLQRKVDFFPRRIERRHSENESLTKESRGEFKKGTSCPPQMKFPQLGEENIPVEDIPFPVGPPPFENCFFLRETTETVSNPSMPPSRDRDEDCPDVQTEKATSPSGIFQRSSKIKFSFLKRTKLSKISLQTAKTEASEAKEEHVIQDEHTRIPDRVQTGEEEAKESVTESKREETGPSCEDLEAVEQVDTIPDFTQNEFYECEDIPTSEDLTNGDDLENEKVNDDKFRNIMQNCLDNAKKFLNVGNLKLFSCSVDDLLELDCQTSPREEAGDANHISRDVLLTSCEDPNDDLDLSENVQPADISMDFVPSFCSDVCPEILPVDNWPYLEEEVPSSPSKTKSDETDLVPTLEKSLSPERNRVRRMERPRIKRFRRKSLVVTSGLEEARRCSKVGARRRKTIDSIAFGSDIRDMRDELMRWEEGGEEENVKRGVHVKKYLDYKSPTWQPKVMLFRISKNELRKVLKCSKTRKRFASESSPKNRVSSEFENGVVREVKEQKPYIKSTESPVEVKKAEDDRKGESAIYLSKLGSIKGSLNPTTSEMKKRKKSRFRNLHTKKRVEPVAKKEANSQSIAHTTPVGLDATFAKMFGDGDSVSDSQVTNSVEVSEDENKHREKRREYRDKKREKSERRHKDRSRERESRKHGRHDRGKHDGKSSSDGRKRDKSESEERRAGEEKKGDKIRRLSPEGLWVCEVCGFDDASERVLHIKNHPFHCQSCHLAFKTEAHFISHLTKRHKDIRNQHHCLLCELSFDTENEYQRHLGTREHRHLESVEKNTINTLFTLLTGAPCPVFGLLEMKPEWLPSQAGTVHFYHQATPLSLALQYLKMHHESASGAAHPN